jgi:hypothetical protein
LFGEFFHSCSVSVFLSRAISASYRASSEAVSQGMSDQIIRLMAEVPVRYSRPFIELAGSFGQWSDTRLNPSIVFCLAKLISNPDPDAVDSALGALLGFVRWSHFCCEAVLTSKDFILILDILPEATPRIRSSIFRLFGAILYRPEIIPESTAARLLGVVLRFLWISTEEEEVLAIVDAGKDGC